MTREESKHIASVVALGCIVVFPDTGERCGAPSEAHHIRSGMGMGQRNSHFRVLGLCPVHHRIGGFGVAIHAGQKTWEKKFGSERELLAKTLKELGITAPQE